jgi:methylmalonyl-CoA/ethylmalonyl-CoA epimerase
MRVLGIRHLTIAVRDLTAARDAFTSLFGAEASAMIDVEAFGARTQDLALGGDTLQLTTPRDRQGALQRFIERRGEGVYTVALEVDDLDAAVEELAAKGVRVSEPVDTPAGLRTAFVTMSATHGVSIQLVQDMSQAQQTPTFERPAEPTADESSAEPTAETPMPEPEPKRELDLTPDEWSDVD